MKLFQELYSWTPELLRELRQAYTLPKKQKGEALDALQRRTGWPRSAFKNKAGALNLTSERRTWTAAEDRIIRMNAGECSPDRIARHLGRSRYSVMGRAVQLGLSMAVRTDYSVPELALIFGVPPEKVYRWIDRGLLGHARTTNTGRRVKDESLVRFIREHTDEYSFRLADETFIKGVLFGTGKGLSGEVVEDAARRGKETRARSRGSEGGAAGAVAERCERGRSGELFTPMEPSSTPPARASA